MLYVANKIYIKKLRSAKIKVLFEIFNSHNSTKIEENFASFTSYTCFQVGSQKNYRRMFKRNVLPYLASSSQIWLNIFVDHLPFWLHHKIDPEKKQKKTHVYHVGHKTTLEPSQLVATDTYWLLILNLLATNSQFLTY